MALCRLKTIALGTSLLAGLTLGVGCAEDSTASAGGGEGGSASGAGGTGGAGGSTQASTTNASTTIGSGGGGEAACFDSGPGEPNHDETSAYQLAPQEDADTIGTINGVLDGPADADWYVYTGTDTPFGSVDPTATLTVSGPTTQVCVFVECLSADTDPVTCSPGASMETSPDGRAGCCEWSTVTLGINCVNTLSDDAKVFIRVDSPTGVACEEYVIEYHY